MGVLPDYRIRCCGVSNGSCVISISDGAYVRDVTVRQREYVDIAKMYIASAMSGNDDAATELERQLLSRY